MHLNVLSNEAAYHRQLPTDYVDAIKVFTRNMYELVVSDEYPNRTQAFISQQPHQLDELINGSIQDFCLDYKASQTCVPLVLVLHNERQMRRIEVNVAVMIYRTLLQQKPRTTEKAKQGWIKSIPKQVLKIRHVSNEVNQSSCQAPILMTAAIHIVPKDKIQLQQISPETEIVPKSTPIPTKAQSETPEDVEENTLIIVCDPKVDYPHPNSVNGSVNNPLNATFVKQNGLITRTAPLPNENFRMVN